MTNAAVACPRNVWAKAVDDASITGAARRYSPAALGADVHSRLRCRTRPENRGRVVRNSVTRGFKLGRVDFSRHSGFAGEGQRSAGMITVLPSECASR